MGERRRRRRQRRGQHSFPQWVLHLLLLAQPWERALNLSQHYPHNPLNHEPSETELFPIMTSQWLSYDV